MLAGKHLVPQPDLAFLLHHGVIAAEPRIAFPQGVRGQQLLPRGLRRVHRQRNPLGHLEEFVIDEQLLLRADVDRLLRRRGRRQEEKDSGH